MTSLEPLTKNSTQLASLLRSLAELLGQYGNGGAPAPAPVPPPAMPAMKIAKVDEDEQLVFGWASVSEDREGRTVVDSDGEVIEPADLEKAVYDYVLNVRESGERHREYDDSEEPPGRVVESLMLTPEKASAMGLTVPQVTGWWVGVKIDDPDVFAKVKDGTYRMFSIQGTAEVEETETV